MFRLAPTAMFPMDATLYSRLKDTLIIIKDTILSALSTINRALKEFEIENQPYHYTPYTEIEIDEYIAHLESYHGEQAVESYYKLLPLLKECNIHQTFQQKCILQFDCLEFIQICLDELEDNTTDFTEMYYYLKSHYNNHDLITHILKDELNTLEEYL